MHRPQFSIRTLLWLTLVVATFLGGILFERARIEAERLARENVLEVESPLLEDEGPGELPAFRAPAE